MPVYVTDTHPLVWYAAAEHRKLSKKALRIFDQAWRSQALVYVPVVALWEISILIKLDIIRLPVEFSVWANALALKPGFDVAPLDSAAMEEFLRLRINNDPFDEAIVATARIRDLPLITKDKAITDSNLIETIW